MSVIIYILSMCLQYGGTSFYIQYARSLSGAYYQDHGQEPKSAQGQG